MKKSIFFAAVTVAGMTLFALLSCGKGNNSYTNSSGNGGTSSSGISMYNMTFSPSSKTVSLGAVVKWTNNDGYSHTVTSNDGTSFSSGTIAGGGTYSYTASVAGTFAYHCTIHGTSMSGTLIVTP